MGNLGTAEILIIFLVALIVLGPDKLPGAAKQVGRVFSQIKSVSSGFQREMQQAMNDPLNAGQAASNDQQSVEAKRSEVADKLRASTAEDDVELARPAEATSAPAEAEAVPDDAD